MSGVRTRMAAAALLIALPAAGAEEPVLPVAASGADRRILNEIDEPELRRLLAETVERNPAVLAADARARAATHKAPQVRALPDPVAAVTAFVATPETRTGPQRLSLAVSQALPWLGKLERQERAALFAAAALTAEAEADRLELVTKARGLYYEIAFVDAQRQITEEFRSHLLQHEEIARARYSTGVGGGQGVIKLQAEITRVDKELLDLESRRLALVARLNALRDRPASTAITPSLTPTAGEAALDAEGLLARALELRPEMAAARARLARADAMIELAELGYRPDFKVGLTYTLVDPRDDAAGRLTPPASNGDDVFGIQGGITLPLWRQKLAAGLAEALELKLAAEEARHGTVAAIEAEIGDLALRVPLAWRQLRLVEDLLIVQAEEALESVQAGYIAGTQNALDLLDAEHTLFEARTARERAETDYLVGLARLEGALAAPLASAVNPERGES